MRVSEPLTSVRDPPAHHRDRKGRDQSPPQRQHEICDQSKQNEHNPEDFLLHGFIVGESSN